MSGTLQRCPVCSWPMAANAKQGCVPGNCSMRPAWKREPLSHGPTCPCSDCNPLEVELRILRAENAAAIENTKQQETICREMLADNMRLRAKNETLRALLRELEWAGSVDERRTCPKCDAEKGFSAHAPDCRLAAALATETKEPAK